MFWLVTVLQTRRDNLLLLTALPSIDTGGRSLKHALVSVAGHNSGHFALLHFLIKYSSEQVICHNETVSGCCLGCGSISSLTSPGQALVELVAGAGGGSRPKLLVIKYLFVICYLLSRYLTFILPSTQTKRNTAQAFRRWSVS